LLFWCRKTAIQLQANGYEWFFSFKQILRILS
jgi:hypothetical protein